jgi:hypothetical protein
MLCSTYTTNTPACDYTRVAARVIHTRHSKSPGYNSDASYLGKYTPRGTRPYNSTSSVLPSIRTTRPHTACTSRRPRCCTALLHISTPSRSWTPRDSCTRHHTAQSTMQSSTEMYLHIDLQDTPSTLPLPICCTCPANT